MTPFDFAHRLIGEVLERPGPKHHPFIVWCHESCNLVDTSDEVPWCSSFANRVCWMLRLPRSKSAAARSWLGVGIAIPLGAAKVGHDVVVLKRGSNPASGHVGFYAGRDDDGDVLVLGGNQGNAVTIAAFKESDVLGVRRLSAAA